MKKPKKTNVMRLLDRAKIPYEPVEYVVDESDLSGLHVANEMGQDPRQVFKTLVLRGSKKGYFVCVIPVAESVDLKKAAKALGDKKAEMIHVKELTPLTGYLRGGCSPIGMKKSFPTFIHESALDFGRIGVSAGERGKQIFVDPNSLATYCGAKFEDLIEV